MHCKSGSQKREADIPRKLLPEGFEKGGNLGKRTRKRMKNERKGAGKLARRNSATLSH
jgi:hypothetical protein